MPARPTQLLLATVVLGMIVSPLIIRYNQRIARVLLRETPAAGGRRRSASNRPPSSSRGAST